MSEMLDLLFGEGVIEKFNPDPADISPWRKGKYKMGPKQRSEQNYKNFGGKKKNDTRQRGVTAGLSAIGATAGAAGLAYAGAKTRGAYRVARYGEDTLKAAKGAKRAGNAARRLQPTQSRTKSAVQAVKHEKFGAALVPLEVAGLGGEVMATKILHGDTKKPKKTLEKRSRTEALNVTVGTVGAGAGVGALWQNEKQAKEIKSARRAGQRARLVVVESSKATIKTPPTQPHRLKSNAVKGAYTGYKQEIGKARKPGFIKNIRQTAENTRVASEHGAQTAMHVENAAKDTAKMARRARRATGPVGAAAAAGIAGGGYYAGTKHNKIKGRLKSYVGKNADVVFTGEISKLDDEKRQVFGWASVTEVNGEPVYDRQGDYIHLDEVEKAAYHYVVNSRKGGDMHKRADEAPVHVSDMVESFVVTPEKLEKMGIESSSVPHGWWVGYQINDDDVWQEVKSGKKLGFSIHGKGVRTPMEAS